MDQSSIERNRVNAMPGTYPAQQNNRRYTELNGRACLYRCYNAECQREFTQIKIEDRIVGCHYCGDPVAILLGPDLDFEGAIRAAGPHPLAPMQPIKQFLFWDLIIADPEMDLADKRAWLAESFEHVTGLLDKHPPGGALGTTILLAQALAATTANQGVWDDALAAGLALALIGAEINYLWRLLPAAVRQEDEQFLDLLIHKTAKEIGEVCPVCGYIAGAPVPERKRRGRPPKSKASEAPAIEPAPALA
jgi:DNA-directed RNA polymerase subunit RPC12/RpoP